MAYTRVCTLDDIWEGEMLEARIDDHVIVLVRPDDAGVHAFQGRCPHQDIALAEGQFDGKVLTCRAHQWTFDACTGKGINPGDCQLAQYPVRLDGDHVWVDVEGVTPRFAHS